jgi:hypothetical protein
LHDPTFQYRNVSLLTFATHHPSYSSGRKGAPVESRFDIGTIATAVCVAGYVAIALRYVALYDLGLSREEVRSGAMIVAILMAALVAVDFFGKKLGKAD